MGMLYTLLSPETSSMQRKPVSRCTTRGFNCFEFASLGPTAYILLLFLSFHEASAYSDYVQEVAQPRELPPKTSSSEDTSAQCWVIDCEDIEVQMLLEETERSCNDHHIHIWVLEKDVGVIGFFLRDTHSGSSDLSISGCNGMSSWRTTAESICFSAWRDSIEDIEENHYTIESNGSPECMDSFYVDIQSTNIIREGPVNMTLRIGRECRTCQLPFFFGDRAGSNCTDLCDELDSSSTFFSPSPEAALSPLPSVSSTSSVHTPSSNSPFPSTSLLSSPSLTPSHSCILTPSPSAVPSASKFSWSGSSTPAILPTQTVSPSPSLQTIPSSTFASASPSPDTPSPSAVASTSHLSSEGLFPSGSASPSPSGTPSPSQLLDAGPWAPGSLQTGNDESVGGPLLAGIIVGTTVPSLIAAGLLLLLLARLIKRLWQNNAQPPFFPALDNIGDLSSSATSVELYDSGVRLNPTYVGAAI